MNSSCVVKGTKIAVEVVVSARLRLETSLQFGHLVPAQGQAADHARLLHTVEPSQRAVVAVGNAVHLTHGVFQLLPRSFGIQHQRGAALKSLI